MNEFDLIARYFTQEAPEGMLGVGDDCALVPVAPGHVLATSTDLLIENQHFFSNVDPAALGHKALAVNVSDLGAMGARPLACLLGLSLPQINEAWLAEFSRGFLELSRATECPLVGGDTTRSPGGIAISVTVLGQVKPQQALRRSAAQVGDDIWVTGSLGGADIALRLLQGRLPANTRLLEQVRSHLEWPQPPCLFGAALAGVAHAAIDLSDGLLQDLGHILKASGCGAHLDYQALPVAAGLDQLDPHILQSALLTGGDVYQLCFTANPAQAQTLQTLAQAHRVQLSRVGRIVRTPGLQVFAHGQELALPSHGGFDHFA
jgi:thiamine-monophosphate kinase